jgi:hypothetical protein
MLQTLVGDSAYQPNLEGGSDDVRWSLSGAPRQADSPSDSALLSAVIVDVSCLLCLCLLLLCFGCKWPLSRYGLPSRPKQSARGSRLRLFSFMSECEREWTAP